jgi:hypothetical protein
MRIRSDRTFLFKGSDEEITIKAGETKDVPDWVAKTDLFKLAQKDKAVLVISTRKDKKKAENEESLNNGSTQLPADK